MSPKRFAGLFGAAPAVAIAGLVVILLTKGAHDARESSIGMIAGTVGLLAYAATAVRAIRSDHPIAGPAVALAAWLLPTAIIAALLL